MSLILIPPIPITNTVLTSSNIAETDYSTWSAASTYVLGDRVILTSTHKVYEVVLAQAIAQVTITIASPGLIQWVSHNLLDGTPVIFATNGVLPSGIVAGTTYFVKSPTLNSFNVAATLGGSAINTSGSQSGTHTATAQSIFNKDPSVATNSIYWLAVGPTNKWKMFDTSNTTTTVATSPISITLLPGQSANGIGLFGLVSSSVRVRMTDPVAGTVYDKTTVTSGAITAPNWYNYFFDISKPISTFVATDLPAYPNGSILIDITNSSGNVSCSTCIVGYQYSIGVGVQYGAKIGITDYSTKTVNSFGDYVLTQRAYSKRASFDMLINKAEVDTIQDILATYRATPCLWVGTDSYSSTTLFGFYKDFNTVISYPTSSLLTLEIEGMT